MLPAPGPPVVGSGATLFPVPGRIVGRGGYVAGMTAKRRPRADDRAAPAGHYPRMSHLDASSPGVVVRVAGWCVRHRGRVLIGWLVIVVAAIAVTSGIGTRAANQFSLGGTESQQAQDLLTQAFPAQSGDVDQVVFGARTGRITDPAVRAQIAPVLSRIRGLPHVSDVTGPYQNGAAQISRDGRIAFATVTFDEQAPALSQPTVERVISTAEQARSPGLEVELGGAAIEETQTVSFGGASALGLAAAVVVLLIAFGSFLAMGLPIVTALLGLGTGFGAIALASQVIDMPNFSAQLAAMIGLGVGIDYSLFIVTRFRQSYNDDTGAATLTAMSTAGRAVLFAGSTVIIALLGMFALGVSFLNGLAVASAIAVFFTMLAALTALPALLSRIGRRISRGRVARSQRGLSGEDGNGFWARWARLIRRHPWPAALTGLAIMLVIAVPALSLRMALSDAGNDPAGTTTRKAYDLLAEGFGRGFNGPLEVVAQLPRANDQTARGRVDAVLSHTPGIVAVAPAVTSPSGRIAVYQAFPRTAPQAAATSDLVTRLRDTVLPPVAHSTGATLLVGGPTAGSIDFTSVLSNKLPVFIAIVVGLAALLLLVVFRSLVIPVQAAVMNLLSIGAALGLTVAVFQNGWFTGVIGVDKGPIDSWVPVMLFAIVFGLSMDYEVFLVSRIHEEWTKRRDPSHAVVQGLATTGRVITAAATIMICVFLAFVLLPERPVKIFGLSLATAVFLDAFVVRSLLLPAVLLLLGRRTWWLPGWLDRRLPQVPMEPREAAAPAGPQPGRR
jgi:putative drug exporter of the RND superfamily